MSPEPLGTSDPAPAARAAVDIAAPPEAVFDALTDPEQLAAWWGGEGAAAAAQAWHTDPRPGGEWRVRTTDPSGRETTVEGEYVTVDYPRRLEYTWRPSWDDGAPSFVRYDLVPAVVDGAPGTRVTVTHSGLRGVTTARVMHSLALVGRRLAALA